VRIEEWEYPMEVLREAIVNALVHRDYSAAARGTQVQVELYPDRLVVRNPGGLYGPVDEASLGLVTTTSSRNGALLKILEDAEAESGRAVCENRGSGLAAMRAQLGAAGMRQPRFDDLISTFEITLANDALIDQGALDWLSALNLGPLSPTQMTAMVWAPEARQPLTNARYREATGVTDSRAASRELQDLVAKGALTQTGSRASAEYRIAIGNRGTGLSRRVLQALRDGDRSRAELAAELRADSQQPTANSQQPTSR
jgi:ATP-dependent DNA helicase RecG